MAGCMFRMENNYTITAIWLIFGDYIFCPRRTEGLGWFAGPGFDGTIGMFSKTGIDERRSVVVRK